MTPDSPEADPANAALSPIAPLPSARPRYRFEPAPAWVKEKFPSDEAFAGSLLNMAEGAAEKMKSVLDAGKGVCQFFKHILNVETDQITYYFSRAYTLSNTNILQTASIQEIPLVEGEELIIHQVVAFRGPLSTVEIIDKTHDLNIRVFDDEQDSGNGTILKRQKINILINNLRIQDTIIVEYSVRSSYETKDLLHKKYVHYTQSVVNDYWFYLNYEFSVRNERPEKLAIYPRFFRDKEGELQNNEPVILEQGGIQRFIYEDYELMSRRDRYNPYLEIATVATWEEISSDVYATFQSTFEDMTIGKDELAEKLHLTQAVVSQEEKIRRIIEYVQNEIIYLFDANTMDGFAPQTPSETMKNGAGDCKAKSVLLVALLKGIGVDAECVLVNYERDIYLEVYAPSSFLFNHVLIRIHHKEQTYFVDATWKDSYGFLEFRTEPGISHYLPVAEGSALTLKEYRPPVGFGIEEDISISIHKNVGAMKVTTIRRRETAEGMRKYMRSVASTELIPYVSGTQRDRLQRTDMTVDALLDKAEFTVVEDNKDTNTLTTLYTASLNNPYGPANLKAVRYYHNFDSSSVMNFEHDDDSPSSFIIVPFKKTVTIETDLWVRKKLNVTRKECHIDNAYFTFSNEKKVSMHKVTAVSTYVPKTNSLIKKSDLEAMKEDYRTLDDSNVGVGIVCVSLWDFVSRYRFVFLGILLYIVLGLINLFVKQ